MTRSLLAGLVALATFLGADAKATQNLTASSLQTTKAALELPLLERLSALRAQPRAYENLKTIISRKRYAVQHLRNRLEKLYKEIINY